MEYIIVRNENQYVKFDFNNKVTHTSNLNLAQRFSYKEAKSLIKNNIKSKDKSLYKIEEDKTSEPIQLQDTKTIFEDDNFSWSDSCDLIQNVFSQVDIYGSRLERTYDETQGEITDLYHKIEFTKANGKEYNASEGYQLFCMLRDALRRFRKIKDDQYFVHIISSLNIDEIKSGRLMSCVNGMENREYAPRVLSELFEA